MILFRIIALFCLLISMGSCQKSGPSHQLSQGKVQNRFLRICFQSEVRSLDPRIGIDYPSTFAVKMLFEGLMGIGIDGQLKPAIAQSYEISENKKTYIFHLRPCVWSNGDEITAYDFEYNWKKVVDPNGETLGVHNFYTVKNARAIIQGQMPIDTLGVKAIDEKTLIVELEHPTPYFLEILATTSFFPVNPRTDQENKNWANLEGKEFVCNGPFILEKHRLEDEIVVKKNPRYWNAKKVILPGIQIAIIKDPTTQLNLFEKKELDWVGLPLSKLPLDAMNFLKKENKVNYMSALGLYWYFINVESFPFNHKKMRQAFAYAINRQAITNYVLQSEETPAMSLLPHALATQDKPYFADNNTDLALKLFQESLEEIGITKEELPEITINYSSAPVHLLVAEALQEQWNRIFDLNIKLEHQDWKSHYAKLQSGNFQIGGMAWQSWLRDPIYIMETFRYKSDGVNMSRWENSEYQALIAASEEEIDCQKRKEIFHEAEKLILEELPVIPIYFTTIAYVKNEKLKNVYISDLLEIDFRWAYFEED